ncbi:MAG: SPFH domain-containing protein [Clostridia bacterium]|nr:SPFH domain-containing protein [Clostridia bacterium]
MGLIKAAAGAFGGTLADQWKEYFYCDSMDAEVLAVKGVKRTGKRSSNTKGDDNVISNGSMIAVADGQCMIIVENGAVKELCAEPGEFRYDSSLSPTIFEGSLGEKVKNLFSETARRFTFGGEAGKDQRIYYINTKEIIGNKYGTPSPVPFRVVDRNVGLDMDIAIRCHGEYSYKITNPMQFYANVCGNVSEDYTRDKIDSQLKSEFLTALQPAFARISEMGIRYSALPGHTLELANAMNDVMSVKWGQLRGIEIVSVGVESVKASAEDEEYIKKLQRDAALRDPAMAAARISGAQAAAMETAAGNENGAMTGFMGMGFAQNQGGASAAQLFGIAQQQGGGAPQQNTGGWKCDCGTTNTGKFCSNCGKPMPAPAAEWTCSCGTKNTGKFCSECGSPNPNAEWSCSCGAINKGKFCSNCGKPRQ